MEQRTLGTTGVHVSPLCLGTMMFGAWGETDHDECVRIIHAALDAGITFVDTADVYSRGESEEIVGKALAGGRRDHVILATKFHGTMGDDPNEAGNSRRWIVREVENSLRRLGTDWIDLYQVHMQDNSVPIDETMRALDDLVRQGKVRYVGCSNYTGYRLVESLWSAERRNTARFEGVQLQWSLAVRDAEREVVPACRAFGLGTLVWSPLASGFLTGKYKKGEVTSGGRLDSWADTFKRIATDRNWALLDVVREVAAAHDSTPARVSLAWLLSKPECTSIIVGARTVAQLEDNLAAAALKLDPAAVERLDKASRPDWGYPYSMIGRGGESW